LLPIFLQIATKTGGVVSLIISLMMSMAIQYLRYYRGINISTILYAGNFLTWLVFFVSGIYISKYLPKLNWKICAISTAIFFVLSVFETYYWYDGFQKIGNAVTAVKASTFLYSMSVILLLYSLKNKIRISNFMVKIGEYSFGIFLIHSIVIIVFTKLFHKFFCCSLISQIILVALVILCCYAFGSVINKMNKTIAGKYLGF
jgi:peptidoglycan/LPS O-acetylase OafA/YrhL